MSSKNCDFCDSSKNCEKLEKSQFLLRLIISQVVQEVEGCPAKTAISVISAISSEIANKLEKSQFLLRLSQVLQEVEGCPAKTGISAISGVCQKSCEILGIIAMIHGRHSVFFVIIQAQRLTGFCQ